MLSAIQATLAVFFIETLLNFKKFVRYEGLRSLTMIQGSVCNGCSCIVQLHKFSGEQLRNKTRKQ